MDTLIDSAHATVVLNRPTEAGGNILIKAVNQGTVSIDKAQGIVECFVAAIGNKDSVGDIIVPGAFAKSLAKRKPRVVWGHNWNEPIGKVLDMEEVGPNDRRLPPKMKQAGVGGLWAKVQFNLSSERGREAFANVAFFGEEQEWSIGYKTIDHDFDALRNANLLKELELYEVSPVLHGANQLTGTVSIKSEDWFDNEKAKAEDDPEEALATMLSGALQATFSKPVVVRHVVGNTAVFTDEANNLYAIDYEIDGAKVIFGSPRRVQMNISFEPLPDLAPGCACGGALHDDGKEEAHDHAYETKIGRVLSNRNLQRLRQALELLQQALASAEAPVTEPNPATLERKFKDMYEESLDTDSKALLLGRPDELSGLVLHINVPNSVKAKKVIDGIDHEIDSKNLAVVAPTRSGIASGFKQISIFFPPAKNLTNQHDQMIDLIKSIDPGLITQSKTLDFYGKSNKAFSEVFTET